MTERRMLECDAFNDVERKPLNIDGKNNSGLYVLIKSTNICAQPHRMLYYMRTTLDSTPVLYVKPRTEKGDTRKLPSRTLCLLTPKNGGPADVNQTMRHQTLKQGNIRAE